MNSIEDLPGEIWKDIPGYVGYFQISNKFRVKGLKGISPKGKILPERLLNFVFYNNNNIPYVGLFKKRIKLDVLYNLAFNIDILSNISFNNEVWRDVPKYEGLYKISNFQRIFSLTTNKIIQPSHPDSTMVGITKNKKRVYTSTLQLYNYVFADYIFEQIPRNENEIWKEIPNSNKSYYISNQGRIYKCKQIHKLIENNSTKEIDIFTDKGKERFSVGSIAYKLFVSDYDSNKYQIIHLDKNCLNNSVDNLALVKKGCSNPDVLLIKGKHNKSLISFAIKDNSSNQFSLDGIIFDKYKIIDITYKENERVITLLCTKCNKKVYLKGAIRSKRRHGLKCDCVKKFQIGMEYKGAILIDSYKEGNRQTYVMQCKKCGDIIKTTRIDENYLGVFTSCSCNNKPQRIYDRSYLSIDFLVKQRLNGMLGRCNCPSHSDYKNYGGKGVFVCKYFYKVDNLKSWILSEVSEDDFRNKKLHIDRIDPRYEYAPYNCQLISDKDNISKVQVDRKRDNKQLKIDELKFKRRKRNWIKLMKKQGYKEEDLI